MQQFVKPVKWPLFHHPDTPTYYNGRVCLLGDSAHASGPSQAAGAGQGLEDALILSRLLSLVGGADELEAAFEVYDAIRRPRAQGVVRESAIVGQQYFLTHPDFGHDYVKITEEANKRLPLIWWHDLDSDVKLAEDSFKKLIRRAPRETKGDIPTITAEPAPSLSLPESSSLVNIQALDTTLRLFVKSVNFLNPVIPGHEAYNCPTMAFLITNQTTGKQILFDAGARRDYWNYSPLVAGRFEKGVNVKGLKIDKGVDEVLTESGVELKALESVIWR